MSAVALVIRPPSIGRLGDRETFGRPTGGVRRPASNRPAPGGVRRPASNRLSIEGGRITTSIPRRGRGVKGRGQTFLSGGRHEFLPPRVETRGASSARSTVYNGPRTTDQVWTEDDDDMVRSPFPGWSAIQWRDIVPGAQTGRRGGAGPVRNWLCGEHSPAALIADSSPQSGRGLTRPERGSHRLGWRASGRVLPSGMANT